MAICSSATVRDSIQLVNNIGVLSSQSGKFALILQNAAASTYDKAVRLRPLCPTRWTVRGKAINAVLKHYEEIIQALEEMSANNGDAAARAAGLQTQLEKGSNLLGLLIAQDLIEPLEVLNTTIQGRQNTSSGMQEAVDHIKQVFAAKRNEEAFQNLFEKAQKIQSELDLEGITCRRQRCLPKRYSGTGESYRASNALEFYKIEYSKVIDTAQSQLTEKFHQVGIEKYHKLEKTLITGKVETQLLKYPEIDEHTLQIQIQMFRQQFQYKTVQEAATMLLSFVPEVRYIFSQVEVLLRLIHVIPLTSCETECSFSALRRLKRG